MGALASAKPGWVVIAEDGSVYIRPARDPEAPKMKALERFSGQRVKVTGTLRYSPGSPPARGGEFEAGAPEHFLLRRGRGQSGRAGQAASEALEKPGRPRALTLDRLLLFAGCLPPSAFRLLIFAFRPRPCVAPP